MPGPKKAGVCGQRDESLDAKPRRVALMLT